MATLLDKTNYQYGQKYRLIDGLENLPIRKAAGNRFQSCGTLIPQDIITLRSVNPDKSWVEIYRSSDGLTGWLATESLVPASIPEQEEAIERLLAELLKVDDSLSRFLKGELLSIDPLSKSHKSVSISFKQMLNYIETIKLSISSRHMSDDAETTHPDKRQDIKKLIDTYKDMAQRFYTQYELSLLEEIKRKGNAIANCNKAINLIKKIEDDRIKKPFEATAAPLLTNAAKTAIDEYLRLKKDFPRLLQNALDKLRDEWQRVGAITVASQALSENDKLTDSLELVVEMVAYSVGVREERIVIVPGTTFSLCFFTYLDNFAVLTVPIHSVQAPWEWSIFWHELAGYLVRQLESGTIIQIVKEKMKKLHAKYHAATDAEKAALLEAITRNNEFGRAYLEEFVFNKRVNGSLEKNKEPDLSDLGSFEYQFEQVLRKLPENNRFQIYEDLKKQGWCDDWFKELFEDAYSVLAIDRDFLFLFENILMRQGTRDDRHPPFDIRLKVADALLLQAKSAAEIEPDTDLKQRVIQLAAQQILKVIPLVNLATRDFKKYNTNLSPILQEELFEVVRQAIKSSIAEWKEVVNGNQLDKYKDRAFIEPRPFSPEILDKFHGIVQKKQISESYEEMLGSRNYKELLELSFYGIDFLSAGTIRNVKRGLNTIFNAIDNTIEFVIPANLMGLAGEISFECSGQTYHTSVLNWNRAFVQHVQYWISGNG